MGNQTVLALFLALSIVIAGSRLAGALARRLGQPRVLGELLVGVLLGPTLLNFLHWPVFQGAALEETIKHLAELGVLLLMFLIGLEVNVRELTQVGRVAALAGVAGAVAPIILAVPVVLLFDYPWQPALFAGVTLAATSVSISAQVLLELGFLRTKVGSALLATALIDDVIAILLVSLTVILVSPEESGGVATLGLTVLRMLLYIGIASVLAWFVLPRLMEWIEDRPAIAHSFGVPALALVFALLFAWSAEAAGGVATITGAFIAGVGFSRCREQTRHEIERAIGYIAYAFLVPIFFVNVGLETDLRLFPLSALPLAGLLLLAGVVSKVAGCGLGARLGGLSSDNSLRLGVCMISRGEVGLIIASLGITVGVFELDHPLFTTLFLVILLTTVLTPILVRWIFPRHLAQIPEKSSSLGESAL